MITWTETAPGTRETTVAGFPIKLRDTGSGLVVDCAKIGMDASPVPPGEADPERKAVEMVAMHSSAVQKVISA